jgi:glycosyltransferase involved in cell wall biosynthesis
MDSRGQELLLMFEAYWHKWVGSYEQVDLFLSPSRFLAELISQRIPQEKIRVLHNGIHLDAYSPGSSDHDYALFLGRLSREKGIETLLKTHRMLGNDMTLKVVGAGPLDKGLRERYPKAEFLGYQTGDVLKETIAKSAFVVVPSECYENCPMVVLEAMAMSKPVIGSRIGGIPEQIDEGKTGFLFEMGDVGELAAKMKALFQDPDMRRTMGMAARKKVEQEYSLDVHCTTLLKIYKELLSENYDTTRLEKGIGI